MSELKLGDIAVITKDPINKYVGIVIAICQNGPRELRAQMMGPRAGYDYSWSSPLPDEIRVINITDSVLEGVKNATK